MRDELKEKVNELVGALIVELSRPDLELPSVDDIAVIVARESGCVLSGAEDAAVAEAVIGEFAPIVAALRVHTAELERQLECAKQDAKIASDKLVAYRAWMAKYVPEIAAEAGEQ